MSKLMDAINRYLKRVELKDALNSYPKLTIYNYSQFSFNEINHILDLEQQLKDL